MLSKYPIFAPDKDVGRELMDWWRSIGGETDAPREAEHKIDKGSRAELRRCGTLSEVIFVPKFHELRLKLFKYGIKDKESLACVAGLLAHVRKHVHEQAEDNGNILELEEVIAWQMALSKSKEKDSAIVSGLRFRRLLKCKNHEELLGDMRRIIQLLDKRVNIYSLAESVYRWTWNDTIKKRWAYAYYNKAQDEK